MVLRIKLLLRLIFPSLMEVGVYKFFQKPRNKTLSKRRHRGPIRSPLLRLIVHQTRSDRRIQSFGYDPLK